MPTRERPEMAEESIASLGKGNFEVLLYVDVDDKRMPDYVLLEKKFPYVKVYVRERLTYYRFNEMINLLAKKAKGDWLWLWNDDAFVTEGNPFEYLENLDHTKPKVLWYNCRPNNHLNLFPAISRKMYVVQGYFSMSPHCDSWAMDIGNILGIQEKVPGVWLEHRRDFNTLTDETKKHTMEAYNVTVPKHSSDEVQKELQLSVIKLKKYL